MVTLSVKLGTGTPAASRAATRRAGVVFAPATCSALIACVITSCDATSGASDAVAATIRSGTPALRTVTLCAPTRPPRAQANAACPVELVTSRPAETVPPPVVTASESDAPAMPSPSVASRRTRTESASGAPAGTDCALPETTVIALGRGSTTSTAVSAPPPAASSTATRAMPRLSRAVPAPAPSVVMRARSVSSDVKMNGAAGTTACCALSATAVKANGDPATTVSVSGAIATLTALAPGPV